VTALPAATEAFAAGVWLPTVLIGVEAGPLVTVPRTRLAPCNAVAAAACDKPIKFGTVTFACTVNVALAPD
jgi:hypothetical protein